MLRPHWSTQTIIEYMYFICSHIFVQIVITSWYMNLLDVEQSRSPFFQMFSLKKCQFFIPTNFEHTQFLDQHDALLQVLSGRHHAEQRDVSLSNLVGNNCLAVYKNVFDAYSLSRWNMSKFFSFAKNNRSAGSKIRIYCI